MGEHDEDTTEPTRATLEVLYPPKRGSLGLRGSSPPLSWDVSRTPDKVERDRSTFHVAIPPGETVEAKLVRNDGAWAFGRNMVLGGGDEVNIHPCFDRQSGTVSAAEKLLLPSGAGLSYRVYLPPSYEEQENARYPVIYAQDGQALWRDGSDPFGVWGLEEILDGLFDLGSMTQVIVVAIDTSQRRIERLSPIADPGYGGGGGPEHLDAMVKTLKPAIDARYRTKAKREDTAVLGASMGGLFSFYAAWTRPSVFGKAICLSSSFWWANRYSLRLVQEPVCPAPRPHLYLDSGASMNPFAEDANERDGIHHTQAMSRALSAHCFARGDDLHVLSFAGLRHDAASWGTRVAVPLQLMFPRRT